MWDIQPWINLPQHTVIPKVILGRGRLPVMIHIAQSIPETVCEDTKPNRWMDPKRRKNSYCYTRRPWYKSNHRSYDWRHRRIPMFWLLHVILWMRSKKWCSSQAIYRILYTSFNAVVHHISGRHPDVAVHLPALQLFADISGIHGDKPLDHLTSLS